MYVLPGELCCVWQEAVDFKEKACMWVACMSWSLNRSYIKTQKQENRLLNRRKDKKKIGWKTKKKSNHFPFPVKPLIPRKEEGHNSSMKPSNNLLISIIKSLDWNKRLSALLSHIILPKFLFAILTVVRWKPPVFILITKSTFPLYQFTASLLNAVHLITLALPGAHSRLQNLQFQAGLGTKWSCFLPHSSG